MTLKAYKYKIKPNKTQVEQLSQAFGHNRFVWNWALAIKQRYYRRFGQGLSKRRLQDQLVKKKKQSKFEWLNQVNSQSYLATLDSLDKAYNAFFKGRAKHPRFKSKKSNWHAFQNPQHTQVDFETGLVKLPKIGRVKAKLHREFTGKIKTSTVKISPSGKYSVSILVDDEKALPDATTIEADLSLGIDLGIKDLAICSDGKVFDNQRHLNKWLKKLHQQQRVLSRKKQNSTSRTKQRLKVARLHERVSNVRKENLHQVSHSLVCENQATTLFLEDLNVKGLIRNKKLSRHIADVAWSEFVRQLEYKCAWLGKNLVKIDRFYPSSKTCSCCGEIKQNLTLSDRVYECEHCDTVIDRDLNAAINIKQHGLKQALESVGTTGVVKCSPKSLPAQSGDLAKGGSSIYHESTEAPSRAALAV